MNGKKFLVIGLLSLFIISMFVSIVVAQATPPAPGNASGNASIIGERLGAEAKNIGDGVVSFFKSAFGGVAVGDDELLSKFFFGMILAMMVYTALTSFFGLTSKYLNWGLTIGVTFITIISIPSGYLTALRESYGAAGLTILAVIPFLIILAFTLKVKSRAIARGTWGVFTIYYFWMYVATIIDPDEGVKIISKAPYVLAIIVGVIMFSFIGYFRVFGSKEKLDEDIESAHERILRSGARKQLAEESRTAETGI